MGRFAHFEQDFLFGCFSALFAFLRFNRSIEFGCGSAAPSLCGLSGRASTAWLPPEEAAIIQFRVLPSAGLSAPFRQRTRPVQSACWECLLHVKLATQRRPIELRHQSEQGQTRRRTGGRAFAALPPRTPRSVVNRDLRAYQVSRPGSLGPSAKTISAAAIRAPADSILVHMRGLPALDRNNASAGAVDTSNGE